MLSSLGRVLSILSIVLLMSITVSLVSDSSEATPDFELDHSVQGLRDVSFIFYSQDLDEIAIAADSTLSIYSIENDTIHLSTEFLECELKGGCWIGDYIYLIMTDFFTIDLYPITVLHASNLSVYSGITPKLDAFTELASSIDGTRIAVSSKKDLFIINTGTNEIEFEITVGIYYITQISWSNTNDRLATVNSGKELRIHELTVNETFEIDVPELRSMDMHWSSNNTILYNFDDLKKSKDIINVDEKIYIESQYFSTDISAISVNSLLDLICIGSTLDMMILDFDTLEILATHDDAVGRIYDVLWDQENRRIITASSDGALLFYYDKNSTGYNNPPLIQIDSPIEGEDYSTTVLAQGSVSDDGSLLFTSFRINLNDWRLFDNFYSWSVDIQPEDLVEGLNTLEIKTSDGEKESQASVSFNYIGAIKNEPPTLKIINPSNDKYVNNVVTLEGEATDDRQVESVFVRAEDMQWVKADGTTVWQYIFDLRNSPNGWVQLEAKSFDGELESLVSSVRVYLNNTNIPDNRELVILGLSPPDGTSVYFSFEVSGHSSDGDGAVTTYYKINDGPWMIASLLERWSVQVQINDLESGENTLSFFAHDVDSTSDEVSIRLYYREYFPPEVVITTPSNGSKIIGNINVTGEVVNGMSEEIAVHYRINDGSWSLADGQAQWSFRLTRNMYNGTNVTIEVYASDTHMDSDIIHIILIYEEGTAEPTPTNMNLILIIIVIVILIIVLLTILKSKRQ